jgi:methenyltetrahydromethanopterin cyclohydrolase
VTGLSVNARAVSILKEHVLPRQEQLGITYRKTASGAHLIDMGVEVKNGWRAAKLFTEVSLAGFGRVRFGSRRLLDLTIPTVEVHVDHPLIAEMSSHVAFWRVPVRGRMYNLSGPVRAKVADSFSAQIDYRDETAEEVVAAFQTDVLPDDEFCRTIAEAAGVRPDQLWMMAARTGTMTGLIQVAARNVEQVLPTLADHGFDLNALRHAAGVSPLVQVNDDEMEAYGRVNDCLIYGQETILYVDCDDREIERLEGLVTMDQPGNEQIFGKPFSELFALCGSDWVKVPRAWDAPASIRFFNLRTGNHRHYGSILEELLYRDVIGHSGGKLS